MKLLDIRDDVLHLRTRIRLQAHRNPGEARVVEHASESVTPEMPFADMLVAVDPRMERLQRVVNMKRDDAANANVAMQFVERALVTFVAAQIVSRRKRMLGVETQAQALVFLDRVEDLSHLLEL